MRAARFLARRLLFAMLVVFLVSSASLILARLAPGDYVIHANPLASAESAARARARYGLDRPLAETYVRWLRNAARLDFGRSLAYDRPVTALVPERAANTAILAVAALGVATLIGLPLGVITGSRSGSVLAIAVRTVSVLFLSMPPLVTSLLLVFMAARTGWLPIGGMSSTSDDGLVDLVRHMVVPVTALALPIAAMFERMQSQALSGVTAQPFFLAARGRGVPWRRLVWRDALKPSLVAVASVYGLVIGSLLSGSFAVEVVSAWPGLGRLMLDALQARDVYLVAGCAAAGSIFLAAGTFVSDLALVAIDPRTRE